ncbi:hypothetical protein WR25_26004 [Diploscapter pachys]|uniref:Uncharacterized protein n=1 Tax=Diploscapter pachys TaxID=2018661 RepID=A0A2A2K4N0_9BILA|nr:hypothetical protein WR25_26004 [Diploscapter pachys]
MTAMRPRAVIRVRMMSVSFMVVSSGKGCAWWREERGDGIAHLGKDGSDEAGNADGAIAGSGRHRVAARIAQRIVGPVIDLDEREDPPRGAFLDDEVDDLLGKGVSVADVALAADNRGDLEQRAHRDLGMDAAMRQRAFELGEHRCLAAGEEASGDGTRRAEQIAADRPESQTREHDQRPDRDVDGDDPFHRLNPPVVPCQPRRLLPRAAAPVYSAMIRTACPGFPARRGSDHPYAGSRDHAPDEDGALDAEPSPSGSTNVRSNNTSCVIIFDRPRRSPDVAGISGIVRARCTVNRTTRFERRHALGECHRLVTAGYGAGKRDDRGRLAMRWCCRMSVRFVEIDRQDVVPVQLLCEEPGVECATQHVVGSVIRHEEDGCRRKREPPAYRHRSAIVGRHDQVVGKLAQGLQDGPGLLCGCCFIIGAMGEAAADIGVAERAQDTGGIIQRPVAVQRVGEDRACCQYLRVTMAGEHRSGGCLAIVRGAVIVVEIVIPKREVDVGVALAGDAFGDRVVAIEDDQAVSPTRVTDMRQQEVRGDRQIVSPKDGDTGQDAHIRFSRIGALAGCPPVGASRRTARLLSGPRRRSRT